MQRKQSDQVGSLQPIALTVLGAAAYSGLSRSRLYDLFRAGTLPSFHVGGRRMVLREAVDSFVNASAEAAWQGQK